MYELSAANICLNIFFGGQDLNFLIYLDMLEHMLVYYFHDQPPAASR